jgi:hypothetical protein
MEAIALVFTALAQFIMAALELVGHLMQLLGEVLFGIVEQATGEKKTDPAELRPQASRHGQGIAGLPRFPR